MRREAIEGTQEAEGWLQARLGVGCGKYRPDIYVHISPCVRATQFSDCGAKESPGKFLLVSKIIRGGLFVTGGRQALEFPPGTYLDLPCILSGCFGLAFAQ